MQQLPLETRCDSRDCLIHDPIFSTLWSQESYLIVAMAIEGRALTPLLRCLNSCSVRTSHIGNAESLLYSSLYATSHISLSEEDNLEWDFREGGVTRDVKP